MTDVEEHLLAERLTSLAWEKQSYIKKAAMAPVKGQA